MPIPDFGAASHVASVTYLCVFGQLTSPNGAAFASPQTVIIVNFETGRTQPNPQIDLWDVTWDYSQFSQDQLEAGIKATLDTICTAIGGLLSFTQAQVQASVTVQRIWTAQLNQQGAAAPQHLGLSGQAGSQITEVMTYP